MLGDVLQSNFCVKGVSMVLPFYTTHVQPPTGKLDWKHSYIQKLWDDWKESDLTHSLPLSLSLGCCPKTILDAELLSGCLICVLRISAVHCLLSPADNAGMFIL